MKYLVIFCVLFGFSVTVVALTEGTFHEKPKKLEKEFDTDQAYRFKKPQIEKVKEAKEEVVLDLEKIESLKNGILKIKSGKPWHSCGILLEEEAREAQAKMMATELVQYTKEVGLKTDLWPVLAVMYHESRFDFCALGLYPRKWAYKHKMLKRPKTHISHTRDDVLRVVNNKWANKVFRRTAFDLGLCQILSKYYTPIGLIDDGIHLCVVEMNRRYKKNKRPWRTWNPKAGYTQKLRRWVKKMTFDRNAVKGI